MVVRRKDGGGISLDPEYDKPNPRVAPLRPYPDAKPNPGAQPNPSMQAPLKGGRDYPKGQRNPEMEYTAPLGRPAPEPPTYQAPLRRARGGSIKKR